MNNYCIMCGTEVSDLNRQVCYQCESVVMYKSQAITAARELAYPRIVITRLSMANNEGEIQRIMTDARRGIFEPRKTT